MDETNEPQSNWDYNSGPDNSGYDGSGFAETAGIPIQKIPALEWTASEYVAHEKNASWYMMFLAGTFVTVVLVFLITRDILASVVVLLVCASISIFAARKPATNSYVINEGGIKIKDRMYKYGEFRSFSVVEEGAIDSIWLKPLKRFSPPVVMYFSPEDEQKIIDVLSNFLAHEERELDAIDRFSKRMRF